MTEPQAAASVTIAPPSALDFDGISGGLLDRLRGRTVVGGDEVRLSLFGGSLGIRFVVVDVAPAGPAVVTADTEVTVREDPVAPGERPPEREREREPDRLTYDDVGGLDDAIASLRRSVELPLERPGTYRELADRPQNGVLLAGPPGSGKTLLADAVGNETDARYVRIPHVEAVERRYGGFDSLALEVTREDPAIVLLDDLNAMLGDAGGARDRTATVGAVLDAVETDDVVVLGTTTDPDDLDPSLRRGGRFGHEIRLGVPDRDDRLDVLRTQVAGVSLAPDVDLGWIADRTHGFVGADLRRLVDEAVRNAVARFQDRGSDPQEGRAVAALDDCTTVVAADFEAAVDEVAPSGMERFRVERPDVEYRDVGGLEAAKREVVRAVEWPLRYPELLDRVSMDAPGGLLLHGLPGTGKTMLAKAVANATDANFVAVQGPELLDRYVGESERGIREVFDRAASNAPAVLLFDEIDALAPRRGGDSDADVTERVVSQLLTELDGIEPRQEVVVIGATNRPDAIDPAVLRPGRLERVVEAPMPDREAREEIFRTHAREVPTAGVDVATLAAETDGYTGSDVEGVVREAGLLAVEDHLRNTVAHPDDPSATDPGSVYVRQSHFDRALDVVEPSVSERRRERYSERAGEIL